MPELPEVTTISNQLKKEIVGKTIHSVSINPKYAVYPTNSFFVENVSGSKILNVTRIGKVIIIKLEKNKRPFYITIHLAMTGRLRFYAKKENAAQEGLVALLFDDKSSLIFTDQRRFGYVKLINGKEFLELKKKFGPEPFEISLEEFEKNIKSIKTNVKNALLNQHILAGVGNIYANDALFMAGINPKSKTTDLSTSQCKKLLHSLQEILREAIEHKGATLEDLMYLDIYGNPGTHQKYFRVYGKKNRSCILCKTKIEFLTLNGRGIFFCPNCQPNPKT